MSLIEEDDNLNGSILGKTEPDVSNEQMKRGIRYNGSLRDRIIDWVINNPKCTKGDIFIHVSGSGTCSSVVSALIRAGVLKEDYFDCRHCKYLIIDKTKVNIV